MTKIKMCGMCSERDIEYSNTILPEYVGYIFVKRSRRYITPDMAAVFTGILDKKIIPVGVFINEDIDLISKLVKNGTIMQIQLHGTETEKYIADLREYVNVPIIKAYKIRSAKDVQSTRTSTADMLLFDSGEGSGELFDHSVLTSFNRPYFLAGGLSPNNIGGILTKLSPYAVDVSSGIETDGKKDLKKMRAFADAIRRKI